MYARKIYPKCHQSLVVTSTLSGVAIIEDDADGVTMELEMNWDGNPRIVLDIKTRLGVSLPVQV